MRIKCQVSRSTARSTRQSCRRRSCRAARIFGNLDRGSGSHRSRQGV